MFSDRGDNSNSPFFLNVVNSRGDYVIGGLAWTGSSQHGVLTFNGTVELLRSGDLADLNGDGLPDSGYRIGPHTDAAFLTDDGRLFFTATFENSSGQRIGEAFLWMRVPAPGDPNCDGRIDFFDIDPFLLALFDENAYAAAWPDCWRITADLNRDGHVDFFDIDPFVECLFAECP